MVKNSKSKNKKIWLILGAAVLIIIALLVLSMFSSPVKKALFGQAISKGNLLKQGVNLNLQSTIFTGPRGAGEYIVFYDGNLQWTGDLTICNCDSSLGCPTRLECLENLKAKNIWTGYKIGSFLIASDNSCFYTELYTAKGGINIYECLGDFDDIQQIALPSGTTASGGTTLPQMDPSIVSDCTFTSLIKCDKEECTNLGAYWYNNICYSSKTRAEEAAQCKVQGGNWVGGKCSFTQVGTQVGEQCDTEKYMGNTQCVNMCSFLYESCVQKCPS